MTWNPVTGCTKISQGCKHCYAERMARRLEAMGGDRYRNGFNVTLHPDLLDVPRRWRQARIVFVNSMSDLFHDDIPLAYIQRVFATMRDCPHHTFQVLTKRSERLAELAPQLPWPNNVWMGVSVEDARVIHRVADLQSVPAAVRFLSLEPLIGPLDALPLEGIHWAIVGGESGPRARPAEKRVGHVDLPPVPRRSRAILLQAVGRCPQGPHRPRTERPNLQRDARDIAAGLGMAKRLPDFISEEILQAK